MKIYEINCTVHGNIVLMKCVIKMFVLQFQIFRYPILMVSFQVIIAFVNNANATEDSSHNLQNGYRLPVILPNEMFFSYVKSTLE